MDIKRTLVGLATTMVAAGTLAAGAVAAQASTGVYHDLQNQAVYHDLKPQPVGSDVYHDL
jgi:hypothetical protein